jgi:hypothetical protein
MGGGASTAAKLQAEEKEGKLQECMLDVFDLLGSATPPTTKEVANVVTNAAQAISHAGLSMIFFKVRAPRAAYTQHHSPLVRVQHSSLRWPPLPATAHRRPALANLCAARTRSRCGCCTFRRVRRSSTLWNSTAA